MADLWLQFLLTLDATLRVSTPLILCAMAGIFSEKSGIIDISLEGKMLMAALPLLHLRRSQDRSGSAFWGPSLFRSCWVCCMVWRRLPCSAIR